MLTVYLPTRKACTDRVVRIIGVLAQDVAIAGLDPDSSPLERLSEREFEVFMRLAQGAAVVRIATELNLSASTVGTHLYNIKQKLGASNQAELTLIALRAHLIEA